MAMYKISWEDLEGKGRNNAGVDSGKGVDAKVPCSSDDHGVYIFFSVYSAQLN